MSHDMNGIHQKLNSIYIHDFCYYLCHDIHTIEDNSINVPNVLFVVCSLDYALRVPGRGQVPQ